MSEHFVLVGHGMSLPAPTSHLAQTQPPAADGNQAASILDIAQTIIAWSGIILAGFTLLVTVLALGIAIAGVFGFREIRNARHVLNETQANVTAQLEETRSQAAKIDEIVQGVDQRVEEIVRSSYGYNQGQEAYNIGNYNRAADFFRRASTLQPKSTAIRYRLGRSYTNLDDSESAGREFQLALQEDAYCAEAHRGIALDRRFDNLALAIGEARLAVEADKTDPKNWNCLGLMLRDNGSREEAVQAHKQAEALEEGPITAFYLALLYADLNRTALATDYMRAATREIDELEYYGRLKPLWAAVLRWAGAIFVLDKAEAVKWAELASAACNSDRRLLEVRGHMVFLLGALNRSREIDDLPDQIKAVEVRRRDAATARANLGGSRPKTS